MIAIRRTAAYALVGTLIALIAVDVAFAQVQSIELKNPLGVTSIADFVSKALKVMVMVALPIISLFVVYSGFLFVLAQGKPEDLAKARMNFLYVIIGAVLILGAWVIASIIGGTVVELTKK